VKTIPLSQGYVALVDDEDYERVNQFNWYATVEHRAVYARRNVRYNGKQSTEKLHRFVLGLKPGDPHVDHKDRNGLNCQKYNLRNASITQNNRNGRKPLTRDGIPTSSRFKGVFWSKDRSKWQATITVNKRSNFLGRFDSELEAAHAYDTAARQYFGEFACPNFPNLRALIAA